MKRTGLLHLYYGDGKGKTTAAMGLALRAMGSGKRVVILQFLKGGKSGEVPLLEQLVQSGSKLLIIAGNWIWWIKPCCKRLCWNARQSRNACLLPMLRRSGCWMPPTMPRR